MNKYINFLLFGFLLFIIGLIIVNFDLKGYKYVNYLPHEYKSDTETIQINLDSSKKYTVKKAKNQQNIIIEKKEIDTQDDEIITVEINHTNTSKAYSLTESFDNKVNIVLYNEMIISGKSDLSNMYDLFIKCIKDKTIYNYKYEVIIWLRKLN